VFNAGVSTDPEGTGFGLKIVAEVADAHGWTVALVDAEGAVRGSSSAESRPSTPTRKWAQRVPISATPTPTRTTEASAPFCRD
jgi:hypothetical protein